MARRICDSRGVRPLESPVQMSEKLQPDDRRPCPEPMKGGMDMTAPNVSVLLEPVENGVLVFQPLAPPTASGQPQGQLSFGMWLTNNESTTVTFESLGITFPGSPQPDLYFTGKEKEANLDSPDGNFTYPPGLTKDLYTPAKQYIMIYEPFPSQVSLLIMFAGFSDPIVVNVPLLEYPMLTPNGGYLWPGSALDLRPGEFWQGQSAHHWSGGTQLFADDLIVAAWDHGIGQWNAHLPGTDGTQNEHWRSWGKPIRAMAEGTVAAFLDGQPTNPKPGAIAPNVPNSGNYFAINHGDEIVNYCHLQAGTLNPSLTRNGAKVTAGTVLGSSGSSGYSTYPHLHVHASVADGPRAGYALRPLAFQNIHVVERAVLAPPSPVGPWVRADGQALPSVESVIWPSAVEPGKRWEYLGGQFQNAPAAASWSANRLDVFVRGTNDHLMHKWWGGSFWTGWEDLGGALADGPAAVSWGPNRIDCFVRDQNTGELAHRWCDSGNWSGWEPLPGKFQGAPAVASWSPGRLDVFVRGTNDHLMHKQCVNSVWTGWEDLGGALADGPAAVSWGPNRIDCFVRDQNTGELAHRWCDSGNWSEWEPLPGKFQGAPAVASWSPGRLDVFVRGTNDHLMHKWCVNSAWTGWEDLGGALADGPAAVSWGPNRIDCFDRGENSELWHRWYDGTAWSDVV